MDLDVEQKCKDLEEQDHALGGEDQVKGKGVMKEVRDEGVRS